MSHKEELDKIKQESANKIKFLDELNDLFFDYKNAVICDEKEEITFLGVTLMRQILQQMKGETYESHCS